MGSAEIELDAFVLEHRLGAGAMGEVWKARHADEGLDVAIKLLTSDRARVSRYRDDFRREVQAVARLNHPHIVMVFDYGEVSENSESESGGALIAGSPYLAMEYASRGSLDEADDLHDWSQIRRILQSLLEALGHSHARGVIHRDLKPANILRGSEDDLRPTLKLADFGLAHAAKRQTSTRSDTPTTGNQEEAAGTPAYMAPEQFRGHWRDYGPWTDLYALGIVTYELVCGELPFVSDSFIGYANCHFNEPLPVRSARFPVPNGLWGWLHRMTAKDPRRRFRRAADAAWALGELGEADTAPKRTEGVSPALFGRVASDEESVPLDQASDDMVWRVDTIDAPRAVGAPGAGTLDGLGETVSSADNVEREDDQVSAPQMRPQDGVYGSDLEAAAPPIAETWCDAAQRSFPRPLTGAGRGLYGLRDIPLVDREPQRHELWSMLREVDESQTPRCALLEGVSGNGKSALAKWLCHLADESGAATILRATHEPNPGPAQGIPRMLAHHFRTVGMPFDDATNRLEELLRCEGVVNSYEWRALAELVEPLAQPGSRPASHTFELSTPKQRFAVLHRLLRRVGRRRPVIVWIDDAQWGADTLRMARYMLTEASSRDTPVLFVATVRTDLLAQRPTEEALVRQLRDLEQSARCPVGPLASEDSAVLIEQLLGLSGDLAVQINRRVDGNPLFAVELVGDWVERGVLELGGDGFELCEGEDALLPDDLHEMWRARIENFLDDFREGEQALEVAAVLGRDISTVELQDVCDSLGIEMPAEMLEKLINTRLVMPTEEGWRFSHGMLRESLVRMATDQGRAAGFHRACAAMLARVYRENAGQMAERRAHHFMASEDLEEAVELLLVAARHRLALSEYGRVHELLWKRARLLDRMNAPSGARRRVSGLIVEARAHRLNWDFDLAEDAASRALEVATDNEWPELRAEALAILAHLERQQGDVGEAVRYNHEARNIFTAIKHKPGMASTSLAMAIFGRVRGNLEDSRANHQRALRLFESLGDDKRVGEVYYGLGNVERQCQNFDMAAQHYERGRVILEEIGAQQLLANCINGLAEVARYRSDLGEAERGYREALRILESIGVSDAILPRLNLGLVYQERGDFASARRCFEKGLDTLQETGQRAFLGWTHANLLPSLAHQNDWNAWDSHLERAVELLEETGMVDADIAHAAALAGDLADEHGERERAAEAYRLAQGQWSAAENDAEADAVAEKLERLPTVSK